MPDSPRLPAILVAGNIVYDTLVRPVETLPPWGATLWVDSIGPHLGGNGAITAYTLGKLGARVRLAGAVGDDDFGRYALARLRSVGVDLSQVQLTPGVQTATTIGLVNSASERLFLHVKGAGDAADPGRFRFDGSRYFHLGSVFQLARVRAQASDLLARARQAGLVTSLDTAWDPLGRWMDDFAPLCPLLDLLFLNQEEARMLVGSEDPAAVARFFHDRGVPTVILKLAARGCAVSAPGHQFHAPAFPVTPIDTTGAGDSFCGGFLAALQRGCSLPDAARFANAVAAHCVQHIGGTTGIAPFDQTLAWITSRLP